MMRGNSTSSRMVSSVVLAVVAALACASVAMAHDHSSGALVARQQHQNIHQHHKFVLKARQTRAGDAGDDSDAGNGGSNDGDQSAQRPNGGGASSVSSSSSQASSSRTFLLTSTPPSANSNTQIASQTSQPGNLISNIGNGLSSALNIPSTSSSVLSQSTAASTSLSQSSAVNTVVSPASSASSNTAALPTDATDSDSVENVTLYSTVSAPTTSATLDEAAASASAAAAEAAKKKEDESSGLGKSTIIIIVVVASCIGGAIAIWTIIRKIKLSPSSRFNRKLAPIDFNAGRRDSDIYGTVGQGNFATVGSTSSLGHAHSSNNIAGAEAWPVHRSPSMSDEGHGYSNGGLSRQPSSGAGALLGSRSGSPEGKSDLGHNPTMSEVGYNSFYPSLPPVSHNHNNIYGAPRDGYGAAPTSDYYNAGVGYSASMRRPNY